MCIRTPLNKWSHDIFLIFECWLNKSFMSTFFTLSLSLCNHRKTFCGDSKWMHLNDPVFGTLCQSEKARTHSTSLANEKKSFGFLHPQPESLLGNIFAWSPTPSTEGNFWKFTATIDFQSPSCSLNYNRYLFLTFAMSNLQNNKFLLTHNLVVCLNFEKIHKLKKALIFKNCWEDTLQRTAVFRNLSLTCLIWLKIRTSPNVKDLL